MHQSSRLAPRCRPSFTLIELIVVLAILLALAALAVAMAPRMAERQKTSRAADQLQGWISLSRQWARSARVPTGIRLLPGRLLPNPAFPNVGYVTDLEYIQQPPDFVASPGLTPTDPINVRAIRVVGSPGNFNTVELQPAPSALTNPRPGDFSGGYPDTQRALWPVQPGDYFQANGGGLMHRIMAVTATGLILETSLPQAITTFTKQYRIVRSPRALPGEATLQLGQDVAIDLTKSQQYLPAPNADRSIDIVFSPSGAVIVPGAHDKIILWVRDVTKDANAPGDQTLIAVYVRTGLVGAFEIAPPPADPFLFTRDGRSSGL